MLSSASGVVALSRQIKKESETVFESRTGRRLFFDYCGADFSSSRFTTWGYLSDWLSSIPDSYILPFYDAPPVFNGGLSHCWIDAVILRPLLPFDLRIDSVIRCGDERAVPILDFIREDTSRVIHQRRQIAEDVRGLPGVDVVFRYSLTIICYCAIIHLKNQFYF